MTARQTDQMALGYVDVSVPALTAGQASGAESVVGANEYRRGVAFMPNADGRLYYTGPAAADGPYYSLYAGVTRTLTGADCPSGAIYVTGQTAGTKLRIGVA